MKKVTKITQTHPVMPGRDPVWSVEYKDWQGILYWRYVTAPDELAAYMQVMGIKKGAN